MSVATLSSNLAQTSLNNNTNDLPSSSPSSPSLSEYESTLLNESEPIAKRIRTVFMLKQIGTNSAIDVLVKGLRVPSVLLAHEIGYVLGQMQNVYAIPYLVSSLSDKSLDPIVRHECAEAIGAIGDINQLFFISTFIDNDCIEVSDTCKITKDRLLWLQAQQNEASSTTIDNKHYHSVDPAPAFVDYTIPQLEKTLIDPSLSLFHRYRAMFALRNHNSEEAVLSLAKGFDDESAVFRHEIAYIFGQMQHPASVPSLKKILSKTNEHAMVRHEAAEALGSIASEEVHDVITQYEHDKDDIVRESCLVALDIADYWNDENDFQSTETLDAKKD